MQYRIEVETTAPDGRVSSSIWRTRRQDVIPLHTFVQSVDKAVGGDCPVAQHFEPGSKVSRARLRDAAGKVVAEWVG